MPSLQATLRNQIAKLLGRPITSEEPTGPKHLAAGLWGEDHAVRLLRDKGYRILGQRVFVGRKDEFDIIARDLKHDQIVFVEVKTRKSEQHGRPIAAVNRQKRIRMSRAAVRYLKNNKVKSPLFRFDVIEVVGEMGDDHPKLTHIETAFPLDRRYSYP